MHENAQKCTKMHKWLAISIAITIVAIVKTLAKFFEELDKVVGVVRAFATGIRDGAKLLTRDFDVGSPWGRAGELPIDIDASKVVLGDEGFSTRDELGTRSLRRDHFGEVACLLDWSGV